jgi:hypothetical protein
MWSTGGSLAKYVLKSTLWQTNVENSRVFGKTMYTIRETLENNVKHFPAFDKTRESTCKYLENQCTAQAALCERVQSCDNAENKRTSSEKQSKLCVGGSLVEQCQAKADI